MRDKLIFDFHSGHSTEAYKLFGAHFTEIDGVKGVMFCVYAPNAQEVQVIGEFNNWIGYEHKMKREDSGIFSLFVPDLKDYDCYKYHIRDCNGNWIDKADPYSYFSEFRPRTASKIYNIDGFPWMDGEWMKNRTKNVDKAVSIYELHFGSWQKKPNGDYYSYEEMAERLIPYIKDRGFTHIEILPLLEHPFDGSWGYLCTGYYNATSRYGNPKQLMYFIDQCHRNGIGVIMDFVPVHFVKDDFGLHNFDGSSVYEYSNIRNRYNEWGSVNFDLGKEEVRSFLISSAAFWIDYFHFDGIRVDAVSNIIYWGGNSDRGVNYGALDFIKRFNYNLANKFPDVMLIAEDSSSYPGVTKPTFDGGLGFDYKWDLGWMNDTLKYFSIDPIYRKFHHHQITFSMHYYFSEKFLLPLSHDEVVHGKGTILNKMWGNYDNKFAQARLLMSYMFAHPGKKLNFMGNEFAQYDEWNENKEISWSLYNFPKHNGFARLTHDLNEIYKAHEALSKTDYDPSYFGWLDADNATQSIYIFKREYNGAKFIFIFNMTPVYYDYYEIGVPWDGEYVEIMNTDKEVYGGYNSWNGQKLYSYPNPLNGQPNRLGLRIAGFTGIYLKYKEPEIMEEKVIIEEKKIKTKSTKTSTNRRTVKNKKKTVEE